MEKRSIEQLITAYMEGTLNQEGRAQLLNLLRNEGSNITSLNELENISERMKEIIDIEPPENLTIEFYDRLRMIEKESCADNNVFTLLYEWFNQKNYRKWAVQIAFAMIFLWSGWMFGRQDTEEIRYLNSEVAQMKEMFSLAMLKDSSPSRRIQALQFISGYDRLSNSLRSAVSGVLQRDANVNVRLVALETLMSFAQDDLVRAELLAAIEKQNEPMMQIAITEAMIDLREERAVVILKDLLHRKDLNFMVREMIKESISTLS